eukprot:CAMPEP_0181192728 /NCGR_PEP_ID=MMETSP1096-20121128/13438_1 /TAXON_ID=156174 ORGANISM="Chrysochromulina ericina, Strain CCMP281" /NCGR_SAMPLE_ID=MMETSP1096 /ASSEMBLY_ACC=CAM_ASM_000453 /LENGTH=203 /DNA_ID=CAMNT_0023282143 /DNA_START=81 /DNA_END=692 /DNA_ORIENTATION=-
MEGVVKGTGIDEEVAIKAAAAAKEYASTAAIASKEAFLKLEQEGFLQHFKEFNVELVKPLKHASSVSPESAKGAFKNFITFQVPVDQARTGFILMNVLSFWVGVAEAAICGGMVCFAWKAALSYAFAYTLFWMLLITQNKVYTRLGLGINLLFIVGNIGAALQGLIFIVPAILNGFKAILQINTFLFAVKMTREERPDVLSLF